METERVPLTLAVGAGDGSGDAEQPVGAADSVVESSRAAESLVIGARDGERERRGDVRDLAGIELAASVGVLVAKRPIHLHEAVAMHVQHAIELTVLALLAEARHVPVRGQGLRGPRLRAEGPREPLRPCDLLVNPMRVSTDGWARPLRTGSSATSLAGRT